MRKENRTGYLESNDEVVEKNTLNSLSVFEQETSILYLRDQDYADIYTSDTTQMTRLDKLCEKSPEYYTLIADTGRGKTYRVTYKSLISFRSSKREMSDDQKKAAGERMRKMQADKKV